MRTAEPFYLHCSYLWEKKSKEKRTCYNSLDECTSMVSAITKDESEFGNSDAEATTHAETNRNVGYAGYAGFVSSSTKPLKAE